MFNLPYPQNLSSLNGRFIRNSESQDVELLRSREHRSKSCGEEFELKYGVSGGELGGECVTQLQPRAVEVT